MGGSNNLLPPLNNLLTYLEDDKEEVEQVHAVPRTDSTLALPQREEDLPHKEEAEQTEQDPDPTIHYPALLLVPHTWEAIRAYGGMGLHPTLRPQLHRELYLCTNCVRKVLT